MEILTNKQGGEKVLDRLDDDLEKYLSIHMKKFISFVLSQLFCLSSGYNTISTILNRYGNKINR
jgi:hypothetical protein